MRGEMSSILNRYRPCFAQMTAILTPDSTAIGAGARVAQCGLPSRGPGWPLRVQTQLRGCDLGEGKNGGRLSGAKVRRAPEKVEIGAPALPANGSGLEQSNHQDFGRLLFIRKLTMWGWTGRGVLPGSFASTRGPCTGDWARTDREVASGRKRTRTCQHVCPYTFRGPKACHSHRERPAHRGSSGRRGSGSRYFPR